MNHKVLNRQKETFKAYSLYAPNLPEILGSVGVALMGKIFFFRKPKHGLFKSFFFHQLSQTMAKNLWDNYSLFRKSNIYTPLPTKCYGYYYLKSSSKKRYLYNYVAKRSKWSTIYSWNLLNNNYENNKKDTLVRACSIYGSLIWGQPSWVGDRTAKKTQMATKLFSCCDIAI